EEGEVLDTPDYAVEARRLDHRVLSFGYAVTERPKPGRFRLDDARALGVPPGPLYRALPRGEALTLDDRRRGPPRAGGDPPAPGPARRLLHRHGPVGRGAGARARGGPARARGDLHRRHVGRSRRPRPLDRRRSGARRARLGRAPPAHHALLAALRDLGAA